MATYSAAPMEAYAWADPNIDLENPRFVISVEWTWPSGDWTYFSLVRSVRAPVRRREEGQVVLETFGTQEWNHYSVLSGRPVYRDPQPPPGEWVYYTVFVLDGNRVWKPAGFIQEIGVADYDWTLRLPELLPGVALSEEQRTIAPAQHGHDLVQFFQSPGAFLDRVVTMAESTQYYWDPLRCPPQMLPHLLQSIGYEYDNVLGLGRTRYVIDALMGPRQGSIQSVQRFAQGVTGCRTQVVISNNLMVNIDDSSFESGDLALTSWTPTTELELRLYENWLDPVPVVPPNVQIKYFAHATAATTIKCGAGDPVALGIPCARWNTVRMGCYAFGTGTTLDLSVDLYDFEGHFLRNLPVLTGQALTASWQWFGNAGDSGVEIVRTDTEEYLPSDVLTNTARWGVGAFGYAEPQTIGPTVVAEGMQFDWETAPTNNPENGALQGVGDAEMTSAVAVGATYRITMTVNAALGTARWRPTVGFHASGDWSTPDGSDQTTTFDWNATVSNPFIGIEVDPADDDWTGAGPHVVKEFSVQRLDTQPAYCVPVLSVDGEASFDLVVVDDG